MSKQLLEKRSRGRLAILLALPFIASVSFAAGDVGGKPEKSNIVVPFPQPSGVFTPVYVGAEAGLFRKYGLNVNLQLLSPQGTLQAVVSGSADIGASGDILTARLRGARIKFFGGGVQQYVLQMWGAKEVSDVRLLKGKTVAVSFPGAATDNTAREVLKKNGLNPDRDVKFLYAQTIPAILTAIVTGNAAAGILSAPNTLRAREAGLNLLVDIAKLAIPGLQSAFWTTEEYLRQNPNVILAFLKGYAEGVFLSRSDPGSAKRAIARYAKTDDLKIIEETYSAFSPYWATSLSVRLEAIQAQLAYVDERQFPQVRSVDPKEFFDNSFVNSLERSGFFRKIGSVK